MFGATLFPMVGTAPLEPVDVRPEGEADRPSDWRLFRSGADTYLLLTRGSRVYRLEPGSAALLADWDAADTERLPIFLAALGIPPVAEVGTVSAGPEPVRSLSLAVAQRCNLACSYCYAQAGTFGEDARSMSREVAYAAVDQLFAEALPGQAVHLAFMGGEPLLNRPVLRAATEYAVQRSRESGVPIRFALTTNGTALTAADCEFLIEHRFSVTVSLDGTGAVHDRLRPFRGGRGSFDQILSRVRPLLAAAREGAAVQLSARVTVTPWNLVLRETLDGLVAAGFPSVGFSPMLSSPTGREEMQVADLQEMLRQMIECGEECERQLRAGSFYPFANLWGAVQELHKGSCRPYSCGAGLGYLGVAADGGLYACHRFVNDPAGAMGDLQHGPDARLREAWRAERHVDRQQPCASCWARYLCGGGCHHEVLHRGRPACDYIRGWLDYCLGAYVRLLNMRPDLFSRPSAYPTAG